MDLLIEQGIGLENKKDPGGLVKGNDITELVAEKTNIPLGEIEETEKDKLLHLEDLIHEYVINQEEAVEAISSAMRRSRLELQGRKNQLLIFFLLDLLELVKQN